MDFDDRRHERLQLRCCRRYQLLQQRSGRRYQRLQQRSDGRYRRQSRRFHQRHRGFHHRCGDRRGNGWRFLGRLLRIARLLFKHRGLEFVQRRFNLDHLGNRFDFRRQLFGRVHQQAVQIGLERKLRTGSDFYRAIHLTPPAQRIAASASA
ncbi:hypothetical protein D3C84_766760 [compost metagenome]